MTYKLAGTITRRLAYVLTVVILLSIGILLGPFVLIVSSILLRNGLCDSKDPKADLTYKTLKKHHTLYGSISRSYRQKRTGRRASQLELT